VRLGPWQPPNHFGAQTWPFVLRTMATHAVGASGCRCAIPPKGAARRSVWGDGNPPREPRRHSGPPRTGVSWCHAMLRASAAAIYRAACGISRDSAVFKLSRPCLRQRDSAASSGLAVSALDHARLRVGDQFARGSNWLPGDRRRGCLACRSWGRWRGSSKTQEQAGLTGGCWASRKGASGHMAASPHVRLLGKCQKHSPSCPASVVETMPAYPDRSSRHSGILGVTDHSGTAAVSAPSAAADALVAGASKTR
jgi:hypothetical protein